MLGRFRIAGTDSAWHRSCEVVEATVHVGAPKECARSIGYPGRVQKAGVPPEIAETANAKTFFPALQDFEWEGPSVQGCEPRVKIASFEILSCTQDPNEAKNPDETEDDTLFAELWHVRSGCGEKARAKHAGYAGRC